MPKSFGLAKALCQRSLETSNHAPTWCARMVHRNRPMKRKEFVELWNDHISQLCKARVISESMRPSESAMTIVVATQEALQIWRKYRNTWKGQTLEQGKQFLLEIRTKALAQNR